MAPRAIEDQIEELQNQLSACDPQMQEDSNYYEASVRLQALGVSVPPEMRKLESAVGWPRVYLDAIEERLDVEGFRMSGSSEGDERLWDWWQANSLDEDSGLGHLEAMIYGHSYITLAAPGEDAPDQNIPSIRVESPRVMTAKVDPRTRKVTSALRVYQPPHGTVADAATLYLPDSTLFLERSSGPASRWEIREQVDHGLGVVPVVPLVNRERLADRMGASEIFPELRSATDAASRILMDMQAAAELLAVPQRLLFGVSREEFDSAEAGAALDAYYARIMAFENEAASATQFDSAELRNFTEAMDQLAKQAAAYELLTHWLWESAPADEAGGQGEEAVVDVGAALPAGGQASELVQ